MAKSNDSLNETMLLEDAYIAAYESRMESIVQNSKILTQMSEEVKAFVNERESDEDSDGYEYVSLGEALRRWGASLVNFMSDHMLFFVIVAFIIVASVVMTIGRINSIIMIFLAFVLLALLAAILLYLRWQDWKDKREALAKAEMLYKAAQDAKKRQSAAKEAAKRVSEPDGAKA